MDACLAAVRESAIFLCRCRNLLALGQATSLASSLMKGVGPHNTVLVVAGVVHGNRAERVGPLLDFDAILYAFTHALIFGANFALRTLRRFLVLAARWRSVGKLKKL